MDWIKKAWRGEEPLWKVFWLYGVLGSIFLGLVASAISAILGPLLNIPFLVFEIIYGIWNLVSLWRSAFNAKWKIWGYIIRIFIAFEVVAVPIGLIVGGVLVGQDLVKAAQCRVELKAYVAQGGTDADGFKRACVARHNSATNPPTPQATLPPPPLPLDAIPADQQEYYQKCRGTMTDYAVKQGVDPDRYITQNQAYLQQCLQYYINLNATPKGQTLLRKD